MDGVLGAVTFNVNADTELSLAKIRDLPMLAKFGLKLVGSSGGTSGKQEVVDMNPSEHDSSGRLTVVDTELAGKTSEPESSGKTLFVKEQWGFSA